MRLRHHYTFLFTTCVSCPESTRDYAHSALRQSLSSATAIKIDCGMLVFIPQSITPESLHTSMHTAVNIYMLQIIITYHSQFNGGKS